MSQVRTCCPHCGTAYRVEEQNLGREVHCRRCKERFTVAFADAGVESIGIDRLQTTAFRSLPPQQSLTVGEDHPARLPNAVPTGIDRFEILAELGSGAFGTVYKARDTQLDRLIALKTPRLGIIGSEADAQRFLREARAAGNLRHPNIVPIYDAGKIGDSCFIASGFIEGCTLADRLRQEEKLSQQEATTLIQKLALALHYAHGKGIVHRDMKPANVMLDADGEPLVMDFGMARRDEGEVLQTMEGARLGTPAYMSPEQHAGQSHLADARSDQWALGVILYEMLVGRRPFDAPSVIQMAYAVRETEPEKPKTLDPSIPKDLETICLKCLQKEPENRYASCQQLADDLGRWLRNEPIAARPIGQAERLWRWCRRNPTVALLAGVAIVLLAITAVVASVGYVSTSRALARANQQWQRAQAEKQRTETERSKAVEEGNRAEAERKRAETARQEADAARKEADAARKKAEDALAKETFAREEARKHQELASTAQASATAAQTQTERERQRADEAEDTKEQISYYTRITSARQKYASEDFEQLSKLLDTCPVRFRHWEWGYLKRLCHYDTITLPETCTGPILWLSPSGDRLATATANRNSNESGVDIWDITTGQKTVSFSLPHSSMTQFSRDGKLLATASWDDKARKAKSPQFIKELKIWDAMTGQELRTLYADVHQTIKSERLLNERISLIVFSQDATRVAAIVTRNTVVVWDTATGRQLHTLKLALPGETLGGRQFRTIAFSADGKRLLTKGHAFPFDRVTIWDMANGQELLTRPIPAEGVSLRAEGKLSPDGRRLMTITEISRVGQEHSVVQLWEIATGQELYKIGPVDSRSEPAFSPDGSLLAIVIGGKVKTWRASDGREQVTLGNDSELTGFEFSADGNVLATKGRSEVTIWDIHSGEALHTVHRPNVGAFDMVLSSNGMRLTVVDRIAGSGNRLTIWKVSMNRDATIFPGPSHSVAFSPDSKRLFIAGARGSADLWDIDTSRKILTFKGHSGPIASVTFSPDGSRLATGGADQTVKIWDATSGRELLTLRGHSERVNSVSFSPDGSRLATGSNDRTANIWDATSGRELLTLRGHSLWECSVTFSPDGSRLATAGNELKTWDATSGRELLTLREHSERVLSVSFSPDGSRLATGSNDRTAMIWDATSGRELLTLRGHSEWVNSVTFSPDGRRLATAGNEVKIWDTVTGQEMLALGQNAKSIHCVVFSPDGKRLAAGTNDGVTVWEASDWAASSSPTKQESANY